MIQHIGRIFDADEDGFDGACYGYVVDAKEENLENFLSECVRSDENAKVIANIIRKSVDRILIIKNITVEEAYQGQGFGSQVLNEAMEEGEPCDAVILMCDGEAGQRDDFVLEMFYNYNDFETIYRHKNYPIMLNPPDLAEDISVEISQKIGALSRLDKKKRASMKP